MNCPNCARPMDHLVRHNVTIDRCSHCGGIWLDHGELEAIAEALRRPVVLPNPGPPAPPVVQEREMAPERQPGRGREWPEDRDRPRGKSKDRDRDDNRKRDKDARKSRGRSYSSKDRMLYMLKEIFD